MIQIRPDADTYEEWVDIVLEEREGTIFDGERHIYDKHEQVFRFIFENQSNYVPDFFIGSEESLLNEGMDMDGEALFEDVSDSTSISHVNLMEATRDKVLFQLKQVKTETDNWEELKTELAKTLPTDTPIEEQEELLQNHFEEEQEEIVNTLREQADEIDEKADEETEDEIDLFKIIDVDTDEIRENANKIEEMTLRELFIHTIEETVNGINSIIDKYRFREEPNEGDYAVFQNEIHNSKVEDIEGLEEGATYNVILKLTEKIKTTDNGIELTVFDYEVIAYNDKLLDIYPDHFIITKKGKIEPKLEDKLTFYTESPLGKVDTKLTNNQ